MQWCGANFKRESHVMVRLITVIQWPKGWTIGRRIEVMRAAWHTIVEVDIVEVCCAEVI